MRGQVTKARITAVTILVLTSTTGVLGDPPDGYYNSVDATNSTTLRLTLHAVIDDHTRFPYTSGGTDTWDILNLADEDPNNIGWINFGDGNGPYPNDPEDSSTFGVNIDADTGELLGLAWGENIGWINFDGVAMADPPQPARVESCRLHGYAWG